MENYIYLKGEKIPISDETAQSLKSQFAPTHRIGNRYRRKNGEEYLLVRVDANRHCCLINLKDGNRWRSFVNVNNPSKITQEEFRTLCNPDYFTLIHERK